MCVRTFYVYFLQSITNLTAINIIMFFFPKGSTVLLCTCLLVCHC
uniref:Uncharacterized protein n=1 Tax=Anguilla anguilla TaxID=7936 RepID=A0A0E9QU27_ANGAN